MGTDSTAGRDMVRARMAEWEVRPPLSVTMAATFSRRRPAVMEGVKSRATRTEPGGSRFSSVRGRPRRMDSRRRRRSSTSSARWRISSSSMEENSSIYMPHTLSTADSAHTPFSMAAFIWLVM